MARHRGTHRNDPDKLIEICAREAAKAIHAAYADFTKKAAAFRKKWGTEGMDIDLAVGNCYFYYKPRTDTTTMFCTCEPSENEPDIIVTAIFEDAVSPQDRRMKRGGAALAGGRRVGNEALTTYPNRRGRTRDPGLRNSRRRSLGRRNLFRRSHPGTASQNSYNVAHTVL